MTYIPKSIVVNPWFEAENDMFADSLEVAIGGEGTIFYRIIKAPDSGTDVPFTRYTGPFTVSRSCTLEAYSEIGEERSFTTRFTVSKILTDREIDIRSKCLRQYTAGGPEALIDGREGSMNWRTGGWQGYQNTDFEAVVDLLELRPLRTISAGFFQDARSWIWMPSRVSFAVSSDGINYTTVADIPSPVDSRDMTPQRWDCTASVDVEARYVRVHAVNFGTIPEWHPGAGMPAIIFVDEISAY